MGLILSRFYDKPTTRDTLEKIEQEIQNIEERRWDKTKREQFIVQILSFIPVTILVANVCVIIYPSESSWRDRLVLSIPIVIFNLALVLCRKIVQWYSHWSIDNEEARLRKLRKQKKKILEMVCETESYRVATELLEKYDPKQLRRRENPSDRPTSPMNASLTKFTASPIRSPQQQHNYQNQQQHQNQSLVQSPPPFLSQSFNVPTQPIVPAAPPPTPVSKPVQTVQSNPNISRPKIAASSVQGRPVRPILSKDRSLLERMVDWVVADGPENRFALICRFCYGHNGMSLAEEYETINFRCCYCYNLNTAANKSRQVHDQLQPEREKTGSNISTAKDEEEPAAPIADEVSILDASKAATKKRKERKRDKGEEQLEKLSEKSIVQEETISQLETTCDNIELSESNVEKQEIDTNTAT